MSSMDAFPPGVADQLKTYVYRLIDPRNGETFYVGKGQRDRVFAHARLADFDSDDPGDKVKRIRDIQAAGLDVLHVIHRHGMDDATAFEVEAALIDAYPGIANVAGGYGNNEFGSLHAQEIVERYAAAEAVFQHKALLISVNKSIVEKPLYEATRYAWKLDPVKAEMAEVVLATYRGLIVGAFVATQWLPVTSENFPGHESEPGRFGFIGVEAPQVVKNLYLRKRVPDSFRKRGAANPIKYTWR